ncbi:MAG: hypothetical protein JWR60_2533 [Polaromonas sp.]|nr:hypothetical protein [Polaromonas sp.]
MYGLPARPHRNWLSVNEADQPLIEQVAGEACKFVAEVVALLARMSHEAGCR